MSDDTDQPQRPSIPPIPGVRPLTAVEAARLKQMAERGQRAQEAAQQLPHDDQRPEKPVIEPDADEHNANWLRLLAQRKRQQQHDQKEHPDHG